MERFVRAGLTFDVRDAGVARGGTVVLLHGFPQDASSWDRVTPRLHEAGLRTLAPDQRGYSRQARPRGRAAYRVGELVDDVLGLLDAAELGSAHLVGHDWGGAVAWETAARHPERVASLLVLSTPHPRALAWAYRHDHEQRRMSWYLAAFQVPWLPEHVYAPVMFRSLCRSGMPPLDAARYARRFARPDDLTGPLAWYRALTLRADGSPRSPITVPTTFVWGRHDIALGRAAAQRTARHVGAAYRFVELDAGHWLPETHPAEVADLVIGQVVAGCR